MTTTQERTKPIRRLSYGALKCVGIYPKENGKVHRSGKLGKSTGLQLTKKQTWKLIKALVNALDEPHATVDITAFRKGNRVTVTSVVKRR